VATNVGHSLIFLPSTGGPTEPLDITGRTLRFRGIPVENTDLDSEQSMMMMMLLLLLLVMLCQ